MSSPDTKITKDSNLSGFSVETVNGKPLSFPAEGAADFLVRADGRVLAAKYGTHAYDQWSVDEPLERVNE